jgi:hypothetical protein
MLGEHESTQPDLPIDPPLPATRLPLRFIPRAATLQAASEPARSGPSEAEQEAARLRQAMAEMLKGLEELRRLLLR